MIADYDYEVAGSMDELQKKVQKYLEEHDGWEPAGGVAVSVCTAPNEKEGWIEHDLTFYQALKKITMGPRSKP